MELQNRKNLQFRVSTALKSIIGKDLINDKYIAVFELVKNAYDAGAKRVDIIFENVNTLNSKLIIKDDGKGMDLPDIRDKWLFIAYSEKKKENRKEVLNKNTDKKDYREHFKRETAGAKGVGRFSCDRLGAKVNLKSKTKDDENINCLCIDWSKFEINDEREIKEVKVPYFTEQSDGFEQGTVLEICELREPWKRADFLALKRALMKLINPENDLADDIFEIYLSVASELNADRGVKRDNEKVNGKIKNDIIEKLGLKTTNIEVEISEDGQTIKTELWDRGEFIFKFEEKNYKYIELKNIKFKLLYLNRSAKYNFSLVMGITPVNYGSVMVYKNGFRIYPYGEPGEDLFYIDRRKSQGRNRYLGTRDIIGRILILGENDEFMETTSRDGGFVLNDTVNKFYDFFTRRVLRTLEKYVVDVIDWGDPGKKDYEQGVEQGLLPRDVGDGIYFSDRKREELFPKLQKVVDKVVRRMQDIVNLRGVVLDNVSGFENQMQNILVLAANKFSQAQIKSLNEYTKNKLIVPAKNEYIRKIDEIESNPEALKAIISAPDYFLDSYKKARLVGRVIKILVDEYGLVIDKKYNKFVEVYYNEIIKYRNALGHAMRSNEHADREVFIGEIDKTPLIFTEDLFRQMRASLNEYQQVINLVENSFNQI